MSNLPFDPDKMKAREAAERAKRQRGGVSTPSPAGAAPVVPGSSVVAAPMSVSQLAASVDAALRDGVPRPVRVIGEVSNFTERTHWYFALKDASAVVSCVMFQSAARKAGFRPEVGHEVVATGAVELYAPQGRLTFRVEKLEPVGAGALELAYRKLCEEIRALGWMDQARKRELPSFPQRIAVITSRTGAALQDVIDTVSRRAPCIQLCLVDTLVQGAAAAPAIARAVRWVSTNADRLGVSTLIVTRGGGSMEDLWAFNERIVAEAIVSCSIPVAAAIGHETDTAIAELVADARCATPTQAAMRCTPDCGALTEQTHALLSRLSAGLRSSVRRAGQALSAHARHLATGAASRLQRTGRGLERAATRLEQQRPSAVYEARRAALRHAVLQLHGAMRQRLASASVQPLATEIQHAWQVGLQRRRDGIAAAERALQLVGPASVLSRGYSITLGPDGIPLRSAGRVKAGDPLETRLAEGTVKSIVSGLADLTRRHGEGKRRAKPDAPQGPSLFE